MVDKFKNPAKSEVHQGRQRLKIKTANPFTSISSFHLFTLFWVVLAIPTAFHLSQILKNTCYFFDSYLTCQESSTFSNLANTVFIGIIFAFVSYFYLRLLKDGFKEFTFSKYKLPVLLLFFSLLIIAPFATFDPFYYLGVGREELLKGINPFVDGFVRYNPFATKFQVTEAGGVMYFPLWLYINKLIVLFSFGQIWLSLLWYKIVMLIFHLLTGLVIYFISKEIRMNKPLLPTLIYLFNPLVLFEFVGQAHFDPIMLFLLLMGLLALIKNQIINAVFWLTLAVLAKAAALYFLPFFLIYYLLNNRQSLLQTVGKISLAGLIALSLVTVFFVQYWAGFATFDGLRWQSKWIVNTLFSETHALSALIATTFNKTDLIDHLIPRITQVVFSIIFLTQIFRIIPGFWNSWFKKKPVEPSFLIASIVIFLIAYLFFFQRSFWPWYASWPFAFGVFLIGGKYDYLFKASLILTVSSIFYYLVPLLFGYWAVGDYLYQVLIPLVIFGPPLVYLAKIKFWFNLRRV